MWGVLIPLLVPWASALTFARVECQGVAAEPIPPNGRWFVSGTEGEILAELAASGAAFWLQQGDERVQVSPTVEDPPGVLSYSVIVPVRPLRTGRWELYSRRGREPASGIDTNLRVDSLGPVDGSNPEFSEVRLANPDWWPGFYGDAILVTIVGGETGQSPLFLDVFLTRTKQAEGGAPLSHNVAGDPLAGPGEWWDRLPYRFPGGYARTVELFSGPCARGLPSGTRVGDEFDISLRFVDLAGNRGEPRSFHFRVPQ